MRYGAMNSPINPILPEIDELAALGFDYLELTMDAPQAHHLILREQHTAIGQRLRHHGMGLVCHMPTFVYTADLTPAIRQASLKEVIYSLETAAELGAEKVVLHPSIISGLGFLVKETAVAHALESLETILRRAEQLGQCICFENMFPRLDYMVKPQEFTTLFETYRNLKLTLDIAHAFIGVKTAARILEFIQKFPERLYHIHISDNKGQRDDHLAVGQGFIPFPEIVHALENQGYNGTITLEIFSEDRRELTASRHRIKALFHGDRSGRRII